MKNTKVKNKVINILGKIKNIVLWLSVVISILFLLSEIIYNNILLTLIVKIISILNIYCFITANTEKWLNN
jgi:hypothetical protein